MVFSPTTVEFGGQPVSVSGGSKGDLLSPASNTQTAHEATVGMQGNQRLPKTASS
jgi:hypothetical protein